MARAIALRPALALLALAACLLAPAATAAPRSHAGARVAISTLESGVLADLNAIRRQHGLAPLSLSAPLMQAARQHTLSMAAKGYFGHESADGSSFAKRLGRFYGSARFSHWSAGENLLWWAPSIDPEGALKAWMDSPPHRENLLSPAWREVGISALHVSAAPGVFGGGEATIITTDFGVRR